MSSRTPGRPLRRVNSQPAQCDPVEVFCRVRPAPLSSAVEFDDCLVIKDDNTLVLERPGVCRSTEYTFTRVFDDACKQRDIFASVGLPLVEELVQGRNGLLFTYGVTGSGKSFTMHGSPDNPGLLPRCLDSLFNSMEQLLPLKFVIRPGKANGFDVQSEAAALLERQQAELLQRQMAGSAQQLIRQQIDAVVATRDRDSACVSVGDLTPDAYRCAVFVSYVEIYNNIVYDLLEELSSYSRDLTSRTLREDARRNMYVSGAAEIECRSGDEAYAVFLRGRARRKVAQTVLNAESSRSHSVFTIRLVRGCYDCRNKEVVQDKSLLSVSQLCLVDLAGSERTVRTGNEGSRLREASDINKSLLVLKRCMETLRENQKAASGAAGGNAPTKMVPYRDSKMTHLFKNYFDGDGSVKMVLCVNRNAEELEETVNVLKFAEMAMEVQVARSKTPATPRWLPPASVATASTVTRSQASAPPASAATTASSESSEGSSQTPRLWHFDTIRPVSPPPPPAAAASAMTPTPPSPSAAGAALLDSQWSLWEQRARLFRAELEAVFDDASSGEAGAAAVAAAASEELDRLAAAHRVEKARLEKRLRNAEMRQCRDRAAADTGRRELVTRLEDQENLLRRERADKERLRDQFKYRMDATAAAQRTRAAMRRSRSQEQLLNNAAPAAAAAAAVEDTPTPGLVSRLRTRFSPSQQQQQLPPPASNPRYHHRRSRSAGQLVVDHHSRNETPSGTVLCPKVSGKRKSVTKLEARDIRKATDYVLTHQTAGADGGLCTEIYKGTVTPTAGGGSAVRFNDVERLEQMSPTQLGDTSWLMASGGGAGRRTSRKRKASGGSRQPRQGQQVRPLHLESPDDASLSSPTGERIFSDDD